MRSAQKVWHIAHISKCIFTKENIFLIHISFKYISTDTVEKKSASVWRRAGDTSLSEPMTVSLLTHICITRPQWDEHVESKIAQIMHQRQMNCYFQSTSIDASFYLSATIITGTTVLISSVPNRHSLQWRHNEHDSVSNHQLHDCLLSALFWRRLEKTPKFRVTGLCAGNSPETGEFPAQMASNAENVSMWWRHHVVVVSKAVDLTSFEVLTVWQSVG